MLNPDELRYLETHREEGLELLKELAGIPAPTNHERRRAEFCKKWLEDHGAEGVYLDSAMNMIYPIGVTEDNPLMVFSAHTDVVFPDKGHLPIREENGRLYCPGVGDDSACLTALLMAARYIAERGLKPKDRGILLVANSGEEGLGNLKGTKEICRQFGHRMEAFCCFDCRLDEMINQAVGSQRYRVSVTTGGGHSFYDFGAVNAIAEISRLVGRLYEIQVPDKGKTTYNVGGISGGTSVNSVAARAEILYEFRSDCREDLAVMEGHFLDLIEETGRRPGVSVDYEVIGIRPCGGDVDLEKQQKLEHRVIQAVSTTIGRAPEPMKASTDCNIPLSMGIPSICAGSYYGQGAHTRGEYVEIASLPAGWQIALDLIMGYMR